MVHGFQGLRAHVLWLFVGLVVLPSVAVADDLLAARLGALLGAERRALDIVPSAQMAALTAPPAAALREIPVQPAVAAVPGPFSYDAAFLANRPTATGDAQWQCLTEALYFEARGESIRGIFAVAEVILNRVDSSAYPGNVCNVVHQGTGRRFQCQFTFTCDGNSDAVHEAEAWRKVGKVARIMLDGAPRPLTDGATHYHTSAVSPSWARRFPLTATIGSHRFYRQPTRTASN